MLSPPEDTNEICEQIGDATVMGLNGTLTDNALKLPDVDTSLNAGANTEVAITEETVSLPPDSVTSRALRMVERVWKRTVQVLTTRNSPVDHACPIAKTSYIYYDEDVYDSVLVEKTTGPTYVIQLIYNSGTIEYTVINEGDNDPFALEKTRPLAEGKKGGSVGLSTTALAAMVGASQM